MINEYNFRKIWKEASWPNLRYYPGICLKGLTKTTKTSVRVADLWARPEPGASQI
jgi:hypothetical protein